MNESVLEAVFDVRKQISLMEEFRILQALQRFAQPLGPQIRHGLQHAAGHFISDDGRGLQQALVNERQPVDARGQ